MEGLIDCVVVLRPTRHKIIHFGDVSPTVWKKLNLAQQKHAFINRKKCTVPVLEHKINTKIQSQVSSPFTTSRLETQQIYSRRKREVREEISKKNVKKERISGEAYDINKQTLYSAEIKKSNQGRITPRSPHGAIGGRKRACQNQLDSCSRFDIETGGHDDSKYGACIMW